MKVEIILLGLDGIFDWVERKGLGFEGNGIDNKVHIGMVPVPLLVSDEQSP